MTYNLRIDNLQNKELISSAINIMNNERPDIIAINEAGWLRRDQGEIKIISIRLGLPYFYLAKSTRNFNDIVLFSKFPLIAVASVLGIKNSGMIVIIKTEIGDISVVATHLASNTEDTRVGEISKIVSLQNKCKYKIILGDLNSISRGNVVIGKDISGTRKLPCRYDVTDYLKLSGYFDAAIITKNDQIPTVPVTIDNDVEYYDLRLDYIFLSNSFEKNNIKYYVINTDEARRCSDHYPVVVQIN